MPARSCGSSALMRVDDLNDVGAGLALDVEDHRRLVVRPGGELAVLRPVHHLGDVRKPHRRAVAIGDDQIEVLRRRWSAGRWR